MIAPISTALSPIIAATPSLVLTSASGAIVIGSLLALAAAEDVAVSGPARQVVGLTLGGALAGGLAQAIAAVVPCVLPLG
jgi:hypothetical protein